VAFKPIIPAELNDNHRPVLPPFFTGHTGWLCISIAIRYPSDSIYH